MSSEKQRRLLGIFLLALTVCFADWRETMAQPLPLPAAEPLPGEDSDAPADMSALMKSLSPDDVFIPSPYDSFPWMTVGPMAGEEVPYFRHTERGAYPTYGDEYSPGAGYPHFEERANRYGIWYRPQSYRGSIDWYEPMRFNPRGIGFPRNSARHRLDYAPAVVQMPHSQYGPHYYAQYQHYDADKEDKKDSPWWRWWCK